MGQKYMAFQFQHYDSVSRVWVECESIWKISPYLDMCHEIKNKCICHIFNEGSHVGWRVN